MTDPTPNDLTAPNAAGDTATTEADPALSPNDGTANQGSAHETANETANERVITEQEAQMALEAFRSEQNLMIGTLSGFIASMIGAGIWAGVTIVTEYQIGWVAIGIGFLVGFAIRITGKGIDPPFGIVSAVLSLLGCVAGNVFIIAYFLADGNEMAIMSVLSELGFATIYELLANTFEIIDLLFYALAAYFGYRSAFRQITEQDFDRALGKTL